MSAQLDQSLQERVIRHLHETAELEKLMWARQMHDEVSGLMVAAIMDLDVVDHFMPPMDSRLRAQLDRVKTSLGAAIDASRRMVEELRPSILDNFGLFAALKWQLKNASRDSHAVCTESYPDEEPAFESNVSTALFRIVQEALEMTFKRGSVSAAALHVVVTDGTVSIRLSDDGTQPAGDERAAAKISLASMHYRLRALGGKVEISRPARGGTLLTASVPLAL